jgi:hypothetical protein
MFQISTLIILNGRNEVQCKTLGASVGCANMGVIEKSVFTHTSSRLELNSNQHIFITQTGINTAIQGKTKTSDKNNNIIISMHI